MHLWNAGQVYGLCCHIQIKLCKVPSVPKASHHHRGIRKVGEILMAPWGALQHIRRLIKTQNGLGWRDLKDHPPAEPRHQAAIPALPQTPLLHPPPSSSSLGLTLPRTRSFGCWAGFQAGIWKQQPSQCWYCFWEPASRGTEDYPRPGR